MKNSKPLYFKIFSVLLLFTILLVNVNSYALEGWRVVGDYMTYLNKYDQMITNAWMESDGMKFYLDEEGHVLYNKVFEYGDDIYFVNKQGVKITNLLVDVSEDLIVGDNIKPGTFYFADNGKAFRRTDSNFIKVIDGKKYAFDEDGHVIKDCWISESGEVLDFSSDVISNGCYRANEYGVLYQNQWYNFNFDAGSDEEFPESSKYIITTYDEMNGLWMYFGNNCKKFTASDTKMKKLKIQGKEYSFDQYGIMVQGFTKNQEEPNYNQRSNPTLTEKIKFYDKITGALLSNRWIKDVTPMSFDYDDYQAGDEYTYYIGSDGSIVKNKIANIENKKYIFDGFGRMRKGFILVDGKAFFVAEYKGEDLSKDDFVYSVEEGGHLYGSDLSDIYYFADEDGSQEGAMKDGKVHIELSDGTFEFGFRSSGRAIGNKNELKLYKNCYYRNGIKLVPWEDTKYGIVMVNHEEFRVINSNGNLVKAKKRVIVDDYGNFIVILNDRLAGYILQTNRRVQLKWKTIDGVTGYFYYDLDYTPKKYTGICIESGTTAPTEEMVYNIPKDLRVNFR